MWESMPERRNSLPIETQDLTQERLQVWQWVFLMNRHSLEHRDNDTPIVHRILDADFDCLFTIILMRFEKAILSHNYCPYPW